MDQIYEEVDMNAESDAKEHTDSENDMQEVIVGEEVIEPHLDEVILYSNSNFEGRPVRRKTPSVVKREIGSGSSNTKQQQQHVQSPLSRAAQNQRSGVILKQQQQAQQQQQQPAAAAATRVPQSPRPLSKPQTVRVTGSNSPIVTPQGLAMKRKLESSPLVVKLEGIKKPNIGSPMSRLTPGTTTAKPKVRYVKHSEAQTEMTGDVLEQYQQIIEEDQQKIQMLEEQLRKVKYTPEMFENDDKRTQYFTGLESFVNMVTLFNNCEPDLPASHALTKFEIFILTLLKLRLKLPMPLLGYMFGVSTKTAAFFFNECVTVLHTVMREIFADTIEVDSK